MTEMFCRITGKRASSKMSATLATLEKAARAYGKAAQSGVGYYIAQSDLLRAAGEHYEATRKSAGPSPARPRSVR